VSQALRNHCGGLNHITEENAKAGTRVDDMQKLSCTTIVYRNYHVAFVAERGGCDVQ
jgi:hypothetical protein